MEFVVTISWWAVPLLVTVGGFFWVLWVGTHATGNFPGMAAAFAMIPWLAVSCIAWIIGAILKG